MATLSFGARLHPAPTRQGWKLYRVIMPLLAGGVMLAASRLPWLLDPLGKAFPAWQLPVDIGWQLRSGVFSYGLLCLCCALYAFFIAYRSWQEEGWGGMIGVWGGRIGGWGNRIGVGGNRIGVGGNRIGGWGNRIGARHDPYQSIATTRQGRWIGAGSLKTHYTLAGLFCLMPTALFFTQYLFIDMGSIAQLAQHEFQSLLISSHFGYQVSTPFIPIQLNTFDPSTLSDRFALLIDQIQAGLYFPLLATFCLLSPRHMLPVRIEMRTNLRVGQQLYQQKRRRVLAIMVCFALLLVVLGRGPAALVCRFQAEHLLSTGEYADALTWLDRASMLNPALEQLSAFHVERGQAWYYLHPTQPTIESQAYLAHFYLTEDDYLSAYQKLIAILQQRLATSTPSWLIDELDTTLTRLAEIQRPLNGPPAQRINRESLSITWLNTLTHIDPGNVYAHYTLGRIEYDLHDFTACEKQMLAIINLSSDNNILSSVYTYLSLSSEYEGKYAQARDYLFEAQAFDPAYRNNTAREEISGLR